MLAPARSTALAFDALAPAYDRVDETNSLHRGMRQVSLDLLCRTFGPGQSVLEIGCGTGLEAVELASRGVLVTATDVSNGMLREAKARAAKSGLGSMLKFEQGAASEMPAKLRSHAPFDGMYASFGPLNCEPDIAATLQGLASLLRPGAPIVLTLVNRVCAWELLLYAMVGRPRKAMRRFGWPARIRLYDEGEIEVFVPRVHRLQAALAKDFTRIRWRGLLVIRPPPYLDREFARFGVGGERFRSADEVISRLPFFRALGDHVLIEARRR